MPIYAICQLTVVFALLPHEWAPLPHRVVPLAVLALDPQDVKQGSGGAKTVAAVDLRVQILKKSLIYQGAHHIGRINFDHGLKLFS